MKAMVTTLGRARMQAILHFSIRCQSAVALPAIISAAYQRHVQSGALKPDLDQERVVSRLDGLYRELQRADPSLVESDQLSLRMLADTRTTLLDRVQHWMASPWRRMLAPPTPRGLYIHGPVGVGKSFLMDLFFQHTNPPVTAVRRRRRAHFHEFMLDVHRRIHAHRRLQHTRGGDPLPAVALELAREARLLCLDEFQVTDIANAMVLKRLLGYLWELGVVLVATSNRAPDALYEGGLNRSVFLPFIDTLQTHMDVVEMNNAEDYRQLHLGRDGGAAPSLFWWPAHSDRVQEAMQRTFDAEPGAPRSETIPVLLGRTVTAARAKDTVAAFQFAELCQRPLGAADYLALCQRYPVLMVENVPLLNAARLEEARRFVVLIDALYETQTKLVMSSDVPFQQLLVDFDATVESKDGDEETAVEGIGVEPPVFGTARDGTEEAFVKGEGGSSSSAATTMIRTKEGDVEWSATGRIGVSLAQLSAVKDVSFSFQRAESRLAEMQSASWGR